MNINSNPKETVMNNPPSIKSILGHNTLRRVLVEGERTEVGPRVDVMYHAAALVKALANGHDAWLLLKKFDGILSDEESAGVMASLLGCPISEDSEYRVETVDFDRPNAKIYAIKEVRRATGWGLKEAKDFIEGLPRMLSIAHANEINDELYDFNFKLVAHRR